MRESRVDQDRWAVVDRYFEAQLVPSDPDLDAALADSAAAGLPPIQVAPNQGRMLQILAAATGARRILEIGTLGGYSTIWLARALPAGGRLLSLEIDPRHAEVATANLARAGLAGVAEVRVGAALETLPALAGPYDLIFIDADKPNNPHYLRHAVRLSRPGTLIVCDNVVRGGAVADPDNSDPNVRGTRELIEAVAAEPRLTATAIQTVGGKGYDGFVLALVE
jgi:predicted O-methyltransferase YrrM